MTMARPRAPSLMMLFRLKPIDVLDLCRCSDHVCLWLTMTWQMGKAASQNLPTVVAEWLRGCEAQLKDVGLIPGHRGSIFMVPKCRNTGVLTLKYTLENLRIKSKSSAMVGLIIM